MAGNVFQAETVQGLKESQVPQLQRQYGKNVLRIGGMPPLLRISLQVLAEPMTVLLMLACALYFILGQVTEGLMMAVAILFVGAISVYQDARSSRAMKALKQYSQPRVAVIRDAVPLTIPSEELVPGDVMMLTEGDKIPADARILQENDLSVNESIITGESLPAEKDEQEGHNLLYQGSLINSGSCFAVVTATGNQTILGKLGRQVSSYTPARTLLQQQLKKFIRRFSIFGASAFLLIWLVNYYNSGLFTQSLLMGLTLAMAVIPEEIPVAFSSFMALGAYRMAGLGIISRQPQTIENLGAVSVICLDKTGTITENSMQLKMLYAVDSGQLIDAEVSAMPETSVLRYAVLASETNPFDAMEKAIHEAYAATDAGKMQQPLPMVYEYSLQGKPPMMTHVYRSSPNYLVAAKGAVEKILAVCKPGDDTRKKITATGKSMAAKGYRVIAVASAVHTSEVMPASQEEFNWKLEGLLALYDPPRKNAAAAISQFYEAKIAVKLLTGDFPETASSVAGQVGIREPGIFATGEQVMAMDAATLAATVKRINIFARMFPEAKLKVIDSLKASGEIVAMTGDGVNDGPALKAADIGIAMGKNGTEVARRSADLVLTGDDPRKITEAIHHGRKIFSNFKKAVRYIISIHVPIILTASLPLLLGWKYPTIFTPVHVIFLELIMGPTCSVFFEREPAEENDRSMPPRDRNAGLFRNDELLISIVQGLLITAGILILYYVYMTTGHTLETTRAMVFTSLLCSNIFLTFANRSFTENIFRTLRYRNNLAPLIIILSLLLLLLVHLVPFVRQLFGFAPVTAGQLAICVAVAFASVAWFEVYKTVTHRVRAR